MIKNPHTVGFFINKFLLIIFLCWFSFTYVNSSFVVVCCRLSFFFILILCKINPLKKKIMFEISKGRFVDSSRIIGANIYNKQNGVSEADGQPIIEVRVAIDVDTVNADKSSLFAGPFKTEDEARKFILSIPQGK